MIRKIFIFAFLTFFSSSIALAAQDSSVIVFKNPSEVRASHILVKNKPLAFNLKERLSKGENFEYLAQEYSICPSGVNGGDLGYFRRGQMIREFEDLAFELNKGDISEPFETQFGWHIIKVYDKR